MCVCVVVTQVRSRGRNCRRRSFCSTATLDACDSLESIASAGGKVMKAVGQSSFSADELLGMLPILETSLAIQLS